MPVSSVVLLASMIAASPSGEVEPSSSLEPVEPAADNELRLSLEAPASCPGVEELKRRVVALTSGPAATPLAATIRMIPNEDRLAVELELQTPEGKSHRAFEVEDCELAVDATAVVLAVARDPAGVADRLRLEPQREPTDPASRDDASPNLDPTVPLAAQPETPTRSPWRMALALSGTVSSGPTPAWGGATGLSAAMLRGRARVDLQGTFWIPRTIPHPSHADVSGRFTAWTLGARGCFVPGARPLEFPACFGGEAGLVYGRGTGALTEIQRAHRPWIALHAGWGLLWVPLSHLAVGVEVQAFAALLRPAFSIANLGDAYRAHAAGARASLVIETRFP